MLRGEKRAAPWLADALTSDAVPLRFTGPLRRPAPLLRAAKLFVGVTTFCASGASSKLWLALRHGLPAVATCRDGLACGARRGACAGVPRGRSPPGPRRRISRLMRSLLQLLRPRRESLSARRRCGP